MVRKLKKGPVKIKAYTFQEVLKKAYDKARLAEEIHLANGGICQHCGKNKAQYPDGIPNMYHCAECNAHTRDILVQLRGPGFLEVRGD